MRRHVTARITSSITAVSELALSFAVAEGVQRESERLSITVDGTAMPALEVPGPQGSRFHLLTALPAGELLVDYAATVTSGGRADEITPGERMRWLRPSRYADLDRLESTAAALFGGASGASLVTQVADYVAGATAYRPGTSRVTDGASDTYVSRAGVCRDFAHLTIAFLRARGVPARLVSCYAPGLTPMDFHAVVEAHVDGAWQVVDSTHLAPRPPLVRIATGADAADTAFMTTHSGGLRFGRLDVSAVLDGNLPTDDHRGLVRL